MLSPIGIATRGFITLGGGGSCDYLESPTLSVVASGTDVIATIGVADESYTTYLRWRVFNGTWTDEDLAYSRTGSGILTVSGLTVDTVYEFIAYVKTDYCDRSDFTAPVLAHIEPAFEYGSNPNWPRWIFASICKHFDDRKEAYELFIEGQYRDLTPAKDRLELRTDGPYITELSKDYYFLYVDINVLVTSSMDDSNYHRIHQAVGDVAEMFTSTIRVYKYGSESYDTGDFLGCLQLKQDIGKRERVQINHFGQIEAKTRIVQASVEGHYTIHLDG